VKYSTIFSAAALMALPLAQGALATEMAKFPGKSETLATSGSGSERKSSMNPDNGTCGGVGQEACLYVISNTHINRIVTPFKHPSVKMDALNGVEHKSRDNIVYLSTTQSTPIAGFITEKGDESAAIKFVLKPVPTGPKEVVLKQSNFGGSEMARRFERSSQRDVTIRDVLSTIAKGNLPVGYQMKPMNPDYLPMCHQDGLVFDFIDGQFISGGDYVVSVGTVRNTNFGMTVFKENHCYRDGVVAVSGYPTYNLMPGQSAEVYVMQYRNKPVSSQIKPRKSLIGGN
jgi:conjugal transfer pilus assembly protein TraK